MAKPALANLAYILQSNSPNGKSFLAPGQTKQKNDDENEELRSKLPLAKRFILDVQKSQFFYDELSQNRIKQSAFEQFEPPFLNSLMVFDAPFQVHWINKDGNGYGKQQLIGFLLYPLLDPTKSAIRSKTGQEGIATAHSWRSWLFFDEGEPDNRKLISRQYIQFMTHQIALADMTTLQLIHLNHYPCQNKLLCCLDKKGYETKDAASQYKSWYCQEVLVRDGLLETICMILNKINEVQVTYVNKRINHIEKDKIFLKPDLMTKGNRYKENYVQYLDGRRRVYPKDELAVGTGTPHQHRYDVRRHPRIVNGKLIWVKEYQRGSGKYIPKIYANSRTWWVNHFWYQAEKLTRFRIIEVLFIKAFTFFNKKKLKK